MEHFIISSLVVIANFVILLFHQNSGSFIWNWTEGERYEEYKSLGMRICSFYWLSTVWHSQSNHVNTSQSREFCYHGDWRPYPCPMPNGFALSVFQLLLSILWTRHYFIPSGKSWAIFKSATYATNILQFRYIMWWII